MQILVKTIQNMSDTCGCRPGDSNYPSTSHAKGENCSHSYPILIKRFCQRSTPQISIPLLFSCFPTFNLFGSKTFLKHWYWFRNDAIDLFLVKNGRKGNLSASWMIKWSIWSSRELWIPHYRQLARKLCGFLRVLRLRVWASLLWLCNS